MSRRFLSTAMAKDSKRVLPLFAVLMALLPGAVEALESGMTALQYEQKMEAVVQLASQAEADAWMDATGERPSPQTVQERLSLFEELKQQLLSLESQMERAAGNGAFNDTELTSLHIRLENAKICLREHRSTYLSYEVVRPCLDVAAARILQASKRKRYDRQLLLEGVLAFARVCDQQWLYEADDATRCYFSQMQRRLARLISDKEWKQIRANTSIWDSPLEFGLTYADDWLR